MASSLSLSAPWRGCCVSSQLIQTISHSETRRTRVRGKVQARQRSARIIQSNPTSFHLETLKKKKSTRSGSKEEAEEQTGGSVTEQAPLGGNVQASGKRIRIMCLLPRDRDALLNGWLLKYRSRWKHITYLWNPNHPPCFSRETAQNKAAALNLQQRCRQTKTHRAFKTETRSQDGGRPLYSRTFRVFTPWEMKPQEEELHHQSSPNISRLSVDWFTGICARECRAEAISFVYARGKNDESFKTHLASERLKRKEKKRREVKQKEKDQSDLVWH